MRPDLEKIGSIGAVVAAAACPICFPKVALVGAALGLGILAPYEGIIAIGVQVLFSLALLGQILAFPRHRNRWLLGFSVATTVLMFAAYYLVGSSIALQAALFGLVAASLWQVRELRRCRACAAGDGEPTGPVPPSRRDDRTPRPGPSP